MKQWLKHVLIFLVLAGFLGVVVMLSGVVNIAASSGHWEITRWILSFSMSRSVSTHGLFVNKPPVTDAGMILRGAGHFEIGCRQCHGGPENRSFLGLKSTPKAPFLPDKIKEWSSQELFWIVKHGVKFTGMPAWPSQLRDDEVWSMVAFLKTLPKLNRESYKELVYGKDSPLFIRPSQFTGELSRHILITCANCHGKDGNGRGKNAFPKLAGQNKEYLVNSLEAYKKGERHSGTMQLVAHALQKEMIEEISTYYSKQILKPSVASGGLSPEQRLKGIERGRKIAQNGIPEQKVAACIGCHGPNESGTTKEPHFPDLRGQPSSYLSNQIRLILENKRGGSHHLNLMKKGVWKLTDDQRRDVSLFYESLVK